MNNADRFQRLDCLLDAYAWLWCPQPYKQPRPGWSQSLPELTHRLLALDETALAQCYQSDDILLDLLTEYLPSLAQLGTLKQLPERAQNQLKDLGPHFAVDIPGRKWAQVQAFTAALPRRHAPVLDWCGGKGHLGRLVSAQWQQPVLTLERSADLCAAGEQLAKRARVEQHFQQGDALSPHSLGLLRQRHPLALHACGGLHRRLVELSIAAGTDALDLAPCCYHLYADGPYQAYTPSARLQPSQDDLRLAVTETVTARPRQVRLRDREMAWKLGFQLLLQALGEQDGYVPTRPIDKAWLHLSFAEFCQRLATRQGLRLPPNQDWMGWEQSGWQRQAEVMRLSLVRQAFRRPLELWLVLDLANHLERHGYRVVLGTFCEARLTPRNILLSAYRCASK